jgi:hypothetical protein
VAIKCGLRSNEARKAPSGAMNWATASH